MTDNLPVRRPVTELGTNPVAERTADLLAQEPARVVWQRRVDPGTTVWVRPDDVVYLGAEPVTLAGGEPVDERPWTFLGLPSLAGVDGPHSGLHVCLRRGHLIVGRDTGDKLRIEARVAGETRWTDEATGAEDRASWLAWLDGGGFGVTMPGSTDDVPPGWAHWQWTAPKHWLFLEHRDVVIAERRGARHLGVLEADGRAGWWATLPAGLWPLKVRLTPDHLVLCGGSPATLRVHDLRDGRLRWQHSAGTAHMSVAGSMGDAVVVTLEGDFARARRLADGTRLWSRPLAALPGATGTTWLHETGARDRQQWVWLRTDRDVFVHAATGRTVDLVDVVHLNQDGLALARSGEVVTCLALPT